jgi:TetR/AcrR family transcriptional regulator, transcriptional repressor for nem operon
MIAMATGGTATRERILDAAQDLVLTRGFSATTVDAVLAAAGVSKGSFFHYFPSKGHLGRALLERYAAGDAEFLDVYLAAAEKRSDDPAAQVVAFVRSLEEAAQEPPGAQPGCLFVSFIYESELGGAGTDEVVAQAILHWRQRLLDKLEQAVAQRRWPPDGLSAPHADLPSLADQVFTTIEGAFLLARALDDPTCVRRQLAHLRHYLELLFAVP